MLILNHAEVTQALTPSECANAVREILLAQVNGDTHMPLRTVMRAPAAAGFMGLMPAWRARGVQGPAEFALKTVCVMPGNPARGLDAHQGTVILFGGETGIPEAMLDASSLTAIRTAAASAVATQALARPDAAVLAVIGAGVQARAHVRALIAIHKFTELRVHAPTAEHVQALLDDCAVQLKQAGVRAEASPDAEHAVRGAEVVVTATSSSTPVLSLDWLAPGVHLNAIGASMPTALEIDAATFAGCKVFADSHESLAAEAGDYRAARERGLIASSGHVHELGEVLAGLVPGRQTAEERTLFRSLGLALEDLAAARCALTRARELGLGTEVPW